MPQHTMDANSRSDSPTNGGGLNGLPLFGSQMVDKNSATPYSDATQVGVVDYCFSLKQKYHLKKNWKFFAKILSPPISKHVVLYLIINI